MTVKPNEAMLSQMKPPPREYDNSTEDYGFICKGVIFWNFINNKNDMIYGCEND